MFSNLEKNRKNLENLSKIDFFGQNGQNSSKIGQKQAIIGFQTTQKWSKMDFWMKFFEFRLSKWLFLSPKRPKTAKNPVSSRI